MAGDALRLCSLAAAVGRHEACPEGDCPFWEPGGAVLTGRCAVEQLDVTPDPAFAAWLLELRKRLATAESNAAADEAHTLFTHLLGDSGE